jgi:uncharacterized phage protein (TIGR01671 family)
MTETPKADERLFYERYLFRGKRLDRDGWIQGSLVVSEPQETSLSVQYAIFPLEYANSYFRVGHATIGQCTSLRDRHGTLIFEGDVIKTKEYGKDDGKGHNFNDYDVFAVVYRNASFCIENQNRRFTISDRPAAYEIIGNISDNPELGKWEGISDE